MTALGDRSQKQRAPFDEVPLTLFRHRSAVVCCRLIRPSRHQRYKLELPSARRDGSRLKRANYFNDNEIVAVFPPRQHWKVLGLLNTVRSALAYDADGCIIAHRKPVEGSNIIELLKYELYNRQPTWMRGDISSVINTHLDLNKYRVKCHPKKRRNRSCRRRPSPRPQCTTRMITRRPSEDSTGSQVSALEVEKKLRVS